MSPDFALALSGEMLWMALLISAPILGLSMLVGLVVSILQVVTQIQDVSLVFVPKLLSVVLALVLFGPWMLSMLLRYATTLIGNIPAYF